MNRASYEKDKRSLMSSKTESWRASKFLCKGR